MRWIHGRAMDSLENDSFKLHWTTTAQQQIWWTHNNNIARRVSVANQSHDLNLSTCLQVCKWLNWIKFTKNFYAIAICVCVFVSIQVVYVIDRKFWQWFMWKCCVLRNLPKYFHSNNLSFLRWFDLRNDLKFELKKEIL